jgi:hypothetical protein
MQRDASWAVKRSRSEEGRIVREVVRNREE